MPDSMKQNLGNIAGLTAGVGAAAVCANNSDNDLLCTGIALAAAYGGKLIGDEIAKNLTEKEQRLVIEEAALALDTGKPRTVALPDSGGQMVITPSGDVETKTLKASVFVDKAATEPVAGTYVVASEIRGPAQLVNVRAQPSDTAAVVSKVSASEALHVFGSPEGTDWVLVGRRAYDDTLGYEEPVAVGYVRADLLPNKFDKENFEAIQPTEDSAWPEQTEEVELSWITTCKVIELDLQKEDGTSVKNESQNCTGPSVTPIST